MRAIIRDSGLIRVDVRRADATAPPGWALLRATRVGIGLRDLAPLPHAPAIVGHEFVAIVDSVQGEDPRRLTGRVVVGQIDVACLGCDLCRSGLPSHCRERRSLGLTGLEGCAAERFTLPAINLVPVPAGVDEDHALLAQPLAAALHAARLAQADRGTFVTVIGDGVLALLVAQVLQAQRTAVRVVGWSEERLERCARWGLKHRPAREPVARADQSVVIDAVGTSESRDLALRYLRPRGRLILPCLGEASIAPIDAGSVCANEFEVRGSRGGSVAEALGVISSGSIDVLSLIDRRFGFNDAPSAFAAASATDAFKVVLAMDH